MVPESCPRVLVNLDHVGDFGTRPDDVILLGKCDEVVQDLCRELGWEDELNEAWAETEGSVVEFEEAQEPEEVSQARHAAARVELEGAAGRQLIDPEKLRLKEEVDEITNQVARSLDLSGLAQEAKDDVAAAAEADSVTGEELPVVGDKQDSAERGDEGTEEAKAAKEKL